MSKPLCWGDWQLFALALFGAASTNLVFGKVPRPDPHYSAECLGFESLTRQGDPVYLPAGLDRAVQAKAMRAAGYDEAKELIDRYRDQVPPGPVLEIGPYDNPLGPEFDVKKHHWLVWEYDAQAARKIRNDTPPEDATVFQVDLNRLTKSGWRRFLGQNTAELQSKGVQSQLSGAVLSSVLNYIDHKAVLEAVFSQLRPGGIIFLTNSNRGNGEIFRGGFASPRAIEALEFLIRQYPGQFEILEGSKVYSDSNTASIGPQASAYLALRKVSASNHPANNYAAALSLYLDGKGDDGAGTLDSEPPHTSSNMWARMWSKAPDSAEKAQVMARWAKEKENLTARFYSQRQKLIQKVLEINPSSAEAKTLKHDLLSPKEKYHFLPERYFLLQALDMPDTSLRKKYLTRNLSRFYQALGNPTQAPNF